jgi:hypothetical protein
MILTFQSLAVTLCTTGSKILHPVQYVYLLFMYIRKKTEFRPVQHLVIDFYNRGGTRLLRGTTGSLNDMDYVLFLKVCFLS